MSSIHICNWLCTVYALIFFTWLRGTKQLKPLTGGIFSFTRSSNTDWCFRVVSVFLVSSCHLWAKYLEKQPCENKVNRIYLFFLKERKKCVPYFQFILNLVPLIFREAGCCGYRHFLPKSSALRVQFLQVTLTELDQVRINALFARPLTKQKRKIRNSFFCNIFHSHLPACILLWHALLSLCNWWQVLHNLFAI